MDKKHTFKKFLQKVETDLFDHEVIKNNRYTKWFKKGEVTPLQVMILHIQFSVFSKRFPAIEAKRLVFVETIEEERGSRALVGSELGVEMDVHTGSIEGGTYKDERAHINWLRHETSAPLCRDFGIDPQMLGTQRLGYLSTKKFLDGMEYYYGHEEFNRRLAASVATECWAAYGIGKGPEEEDNNFWRELVVGHEKFNTVYRIPFGLELIDPRFFQWHFDIETGHRENVMEQLRSAYFRDDFDPDLFFEGGRGVLDANLIFWNGLYDHRSDSLDDLKKLLAK